jgi:hypothetical protein
MVRAAAAESIDEKTIFDVCLALVAREPPIDEELRLAAHGQLVKEQSQRAYDALERDLARGLSTHAHYALLGMALTYPEEMRKDAELVFEPRDLSRAPREEKNPLPIEKRALGKTGLLVSPLAISGAFDLPLTNVERARHAGVNTFFWEPEYRALTDYISRTQRKDDLVVIAGSYEADAKTIEKDVDRALRRLRIDAVGVMLLFWVRSPARLSDEAFECLSRLKEQGKIRATGFSTHLRDVAATAIRERPWDVVMSRHSAAHSTRVRLLSLFDVAAGRLDDDLCAPSPARARRKSIRASRATPRREEARENARRRKTNPR